MKRLRVDLHSHTWYSHDSLLKPEHFVEACLRKGINCIAVTDHNEVDGAKAVARIAPFKVIVGEEIRTRDGEISGLFLKERIPPNLTAHETIRQIRRQKGLVYIPHPFAAGVTMRLRTSDAHTRFEIGSAYVEMDDFKTPAQMIKNLQKGTLIGRKTNVLYPATSLAVGRAKVLAGHRSEEAREQRKTRINIQRVWTDL